MKRLGLLATGVLLGLGACAPSTVDLDLGFDRGYLTGLGIASVRVEAYDAFDPFGSLVDCGVLLESWDDTTLFSPVSAGVLVEVASADTTATALVESLPVGVVYILAVGFDGPGGTGVPVAVGCGAGSIEAGEKPVIPVAMEAL